jgi:hypothetical protein
MLERVSTYDVRSAAARQRTETDWLSSAHSFSFGHAYDPANTHFGLLLVNNEDVVAAGTGFETHPHRDMEIVTWVISGSLVHQDSSGNHGLIYPGLAQRMSAGTGILHSERNDTWRSSDLPNSNPNPEPNPQPRPDPVQPPVHFIQMWVTPDEPGLVPGYEQRDVAEQLACGGLVPVASGLPRHRQDAAIRIHQRDAGLSIARLIDGGAALLPSAPYLHLFVAHGRIDVEGAGVLSAGDAARITHADGERITAIGAAEVLVWEMHAALS